MSNTKKDPTLEDFRNDLFHFIENHPFYCDHDYEVFSMNKKHTNYEVFDDNNKSIVIDIKI